MVCPASSSFTLDPIVPINIFLSKDLEMSPDEHHGLSQACLEGSWSNLLKVQDSEENHQERCNALAALATLADAVVTLCCP